MSLKGNNNAEKIWNFLTGKGLNTYGAAGVMGNLYAESGLRPNNLQGSYEKKLGYTDETYTAAVDSGAYTNFVRDSAGYGLAQWTYWSRKEGLLNFAKAAKASIGDLEMQLGYLWKELTEKYGTLLNTLKTATSVRAASDAVLTIYERPADQSEAVQVKRAGYGQNYFDQYAGAGNGSQQPAGSKCTAAKLLAVAAAEIGYKEKASNSQLDDKTANAGHNNWTKYARDFDQKFPNWYNGKKNGYAWCDMFVDWCFLTAFGYEKALELLCQPEKSAGAGCKYSMQYYQKKGQFYTDNPQPGDQIFFTSGGTISHTGIVESVNGSTIVTIEGNASDQVKRINRKMNDGYTYGFGRPKYDKDNGSQQPIQQPEQPETPVVTSGTLKVGDIVNFKGTQHFTSANATTGKACKPGKAKVTQIYKLGTSKHPYHLIAVSGSGSNVYGWVNVEDIEGQKAEAAWTPKVGDEVVYNGTVHYTSANATTAKGCKGGRAKITQIYQLGKSKHPYHLIRISGSGATVWGWVDANTFSKA